MRIRALHLLRRLHRDDKALAMIEFALALPAMIFLGCCGIEYSNLALFHMRVSHAAIDLADNASRVGTQSTVTGYQTLTETDIDDVLKALMIETKGIDLVDNGRVTISSVEAVTDAKGNTTQWLHWQRCIGTTSTADYGTGYTVAPTDDSGVTVTGIGTPNLTAPQNSGLMYIEVNYSYTPMFKMMFAPRKLHYVSAMIVRATRSPKDSITNPNNSAKMLCNKYTNGSEIT
jgi:Flp pilus assembly protein TadG